ncbi:tail fiber domain-containing protein [Pantoea ananatis]|uniref:tail fiber domain-containing protein n=1 Tax=Pantoea ananas TaxID=553 RepID=UPI002079451D|nr:tail fiber domain-containing protein [Pantoea ananatis]USL56762.1 tail fiber domain-containing protein [Pantoea ananatis]
MSSIFHGGNTYIFYNTDANNNIPTAIGYKNIDELGAFPQVKINSSTTQLETYNDEWVQVLSSNISIDSVNIVVHYVADNESHVFLDNAFTNQTNFQIKVSLYESQTSLDQHYVIINGYISGFSDSADQNEVYDRTYTFTAEEIIKRGTAVDPAPLKQGDYGVGADGETIPQYESSTPSGNSFIKVPALRSDNPLGVDLGGFAYVDNGGDQGAQFVISETGPVNMYVKNTNNSWTQIKTSEQNDAMYVPQSRTVNGKALSSNIVLSSSDTGSLALTGGTLTGALTGTTATFSTVTTSGTLTSTGKVTANGVFEAKGNTLLTTATLTGALTGTTASLTSLSLSQPLTVANGGTGNSTGNAPTTTKLLNARTVTVDLTNTASASFDGTANITPGVSGILSIANGGTGSSTGNAPTTTKLLNARTVIINLTSTDSSSFDGTANITPGISGQLPIANGGTGASTVTQARTNLQAAKSGSNSDITNLTALSGSLKLGADAQADADAVTLRQLISATAGGGTGGATLNGVMNHFLGAVEWYLGSRAKVPAGYLPADGQLLNRADYPDIWNAISTGVLISVDDTTWLNASGATYIHRGKYSTGNGSTTFRMPDLNGIQTGSLDGLFLSGTAKAVSSANIQARDVGIVFDQNAPNITGAAVIAYSGGVSIFDSTSGAFQPSGTVTSNVANITRIAEGAGNLRQGNLAFNANASNGTYSPNSNWLIPRSVGGIWLIRVNGKFSASNTNFNVINSITAIPASGEIQYGGDVRSNLQLNGSDYLVARMRSKIIGGTGGSKTIAFALADSTGTSIVNTEWTLPSTGGQLVLSTDSRLITVNGKSGGSISSQVFVDQSGSDDANLPLVLRRSQFIANQNIYFGGGIRYYFRSDLALEGIDMYAQRNANGERLFYQRTFNGDGSVASVYSFSSNGNYNAYNGAFINGSDERIKYNIQRVQNPLEKMKLLKGVTYKLKANDSFGMGFIAQDVESVWPDAISESGYNQKMPDGSIVENVKGISAGNISAALHHEAILALMEQIETMKAQIEEIQSKINK